MNASGDRVDCVVVGAGVVGLAVARALAATGRDVVIVEAADAIGTGTSSRNSEVIHAGIHYAPGSWKARLCVRGKALMYAFCEQRHVPHRRIGKLVVATDASQREALEHVIAHARAAGVDDCELLERADVARIEPAVRCVAAVWCPSTGIVDSHALMLALLADAEADGATLALTSRVVRGSADGDGITLDVATDGDVDFTLHAALVVNCAGHGAVEVARGIDRMPPDLVPTIHPAKGNYFSLIGRSPFRHLIYPLPEAAGLGIHVTPDLAGRAKFGPDVEWLPVATPIDGSTSYAVDEARAARFASTIRRYWPELPDGALAPGYSGIRPKLSGPGDAAADFLIQAPADHGVAGLINLFGIDSPGLTSSLAIAEQVVAMASSGSTMTASRGSPILSA